MGIVMVTPPSAPPHPTRQQLDDLDDLLRRMLDLPVNAPEEAGGDGPLPEGPFNTLQESSVGVRFADPLSPPPGNMILVDAVAPPSINEAPQPQPTAAIPASPLALPLLNPIPPAERTGVPLLSQSDSRASGRAALMASRPASSALWLRPVLWVNRSFDRASFSFSGPGRWLRQAGGRAVLGTLGLLLLAAAALVLLDWIGWTRWLSPIE
jgi:hypothetical protein